MALNFGAAAIRSSQVSIESSATPALAEAVGVVEQPEGLGHPADGVLLAVQGVLLVGRVEEVRQEVIAQVLLEVGGDPAGAVGQGPGVRGEDLRHVAGGHGGLQGRQVLVGGAEQTVLDLDVRVLLLELGDQLRDTRRFLLAVPGPHPDGGGIAAGVASSGRRLLVIAARGQQGTGAEDGCPAESGLQKGAALEGCAVGGCRC